MFGGFRGSCYCKKFLTKKKKQQQQQQQQPLLFRTRVKFSPGNAIINIRFTDMKKCV